MRISTNFVEPYSHAKNPQKFTQSQMPTILVLKAKKPTFCGTVYNLLRCRTDARKRHLRHTTSEERPVFIAGSTYYRVLALLAFTV